MPESVTEIEDFALAYCHCLRNVAFPPNADISDDILLEATDLLQLFGSADMIRNLKNRFDELPIHSSVYIQSYHQGALQRLITTGNELDPRGNQRDCLGMTPLHILACSYVHNLEVYHLIIEKYPTNLITVDAGRYLYCMLFGGMHQLMLLSFCSIAINHSTRFMNLIGLTW
jgi:hypothetical protein